MSERRIIEEQINKLHMIVNFIPEIKDYSHPTCSKNKIGIKTSKFTMDNYIDRYKEIINSNDYNVLFSDESMIIFYYEFDNLGNITNYNLSYIPSIDIDIDIEDYTLDKKTRRLLMDSYIDYLRIDFDELGYQSIIHTKNHMHIGLNNRSNNNPRNEIRFPFKNIVYPFDFIYIICKYIYHSESEKVHLNKLFHTNNRRTLLEDQELDLLRLHFKD